MKKALHFKDRPAGGFTLVEVMVGTSLAVLVAAAAYTLLSATLKLYAENFSLNHSHHSARMPLERMILEINSSGAPPILVNDRGADVGGDGPAPGVRFCTPASSSPYTVTSAAIATATSVELRVNPGQPKPRESDILLIHASPENSYGNGLQVEISAVTGASSPYTVTLKSALGVPVSDDSSALVLQQGAFIAVGGQLRYYNKVMSEARHGAGAFDAPANFRVLAQVQPAPSTTAAAPFSYANGDHRLLRVNLRARSLRNSNRVSAFNSFLNMQSSIAVKSVYLDPTKLTAIQ